MNTKHVGKLDYADFQTNNVWSWYENDPDTDLVYPIIVEGKTISELNYDYLFILCSLLFQDGTCIDGSISIIPSERYIYYLEFFRDEASFLYTGKLISDGNGMENCHYG